MIPEAQAHVAAELGLPSPDSIVFSSNTHDFLLRLFSGVETKPVHILATDGEFRARIDGLAVAFVVLRVIYLGLYLADRANLRSLIWMVGWGVCIALYLAKLW